MLTIAFLSDVSILVNLYLTIYFINWLADPTAEKGLGYMYATILVLIQLITSLSRNYYDFLASYLGLAIKKGLSGVIFKKILRFSEKSRHKATSGKLVSIISGELQTIERGLIMLPFIITSPLVFIVLCILIAIYFKEAVIFGVILALLIFAFEYFAARKINTYKYQEGTYSEKRLKVISDIINGIRTIKVYAWELPFAKLVQKFR